MVYLLVVPEEFVRRYVHMVEFARYRDSVKHFIENIDTSQSQKEVIGRIYKEQEIVRWPQPVVKILIAAVRELYNE